MEEEKENKSLLEMVMNSVSEYYSDNLSAKIELEKIEESTNEIINEG